MVIKRTGDSFQYENMTYTIGQRIFANGQSDWEGLFGVITEIRTDGDKETENETPDIYCSFDIPVLPADVTELEERFSICTGNQRNWRISVWMKSLWHRK